MSIHSTSFLTERPIPVAAWLSLFIRLSRRDTSPSAVALALDLGAGADSPPEVDCRVEPLKVPRIETMFTEDDLVMREFLPSTSRQVVRKGKFCAA